MFSGSEHTRSGLACPKTIPGQASDRRTTSCNRRIRMVRLSALDFRLSASKPRAQSPKTRASVLRQREHRQHAALIAEVRKVLERADRAETGRWILEAHIRRDANAGPTTDPRQHGDVLLAIRTDVGHRVADDAGWCLELPEHVSGL